MDKKQKTKKILSIIGNVLIWLFVIFSVIVTMLAFAAQSDADGVPSIGGNAILTVQTPSMEPTFNVGDIIIGKKLSTEQAASLQVGDIITYKIDLDGDNKDELNSHRIVEVIKAENGGVSYRTKGDNNQLEDGYTVDSGRVICKYDGTRIRKLGSVLNFLQQPTGFLVVIVIPLAIFFVFELISFIRKFLQIKNAGTKQISAAEEELIRQRAIEEYIRSQQNAADNAANNAPAPEPSDPAENAGASSGDADGDTSGADAGGDAD